MTIAEMITELMKMRSLHGGGAQVFVGNFYRDVPVVSVITEDGYPLIFIGSDKDIY